MVFDRTIDDPKFAKEFEGLFNDAEGAATTVKVPHPTDGGASTEERLQ